MPHLHFFAKIAPPLYDVYREVLHIIYHKRGKKMKYFSRIFLFFLWTLAACGPRSSFRQPNLLIKWEWKTPKNAFIQTASILNSHVLLTLNTGEVVIFPVERPSSLQRFSLPLEGLIKILWVTNTSNTYYGIAWTTAGSSQSLLWFSTDIDLLTPLSPSNTNHTITLATLSTLTYNQVYGVWHDNESLFWAADNTLFFVPLTNTFPPQEPASLSFPYPYRISSAIRHENTLYIAQGENGLTLLDLKRKRSTNYSWIIGSIESLTIIEKEKTLIMADRINGVRAYSIRNPWKPEFIAVYEALGNTLDITLSSNGLWLADQYNGVSLLKFENRNFSLLTNITGRVISHIMPLDEAGNLLLWHQDSVLLTSVNVP